MMAKLHLRDMPGTIDLKFLAIDTDRHGTVRIYVRRHGRKVRLHETPGTEAFLAEYRAALARLEAGEPPEQSSAPAKRGSFQWLCKLYYKSAEFTMLHPSTQRARCLILDGFNARRGHKPFARMEPRHVRGWRDAKAPTPEAANGLVKALRRVFAWGKEAGHCERNPAAEVPYLRSGSSGFHSWTVEEVQQFETRHPVGTRARLALALLLYTGQRRSDIVQLGRQHVRDGWLSFIQLKGRRRKPIEIEIPVLPDLQRIIEATPSGNLTFLVTQFGKPFTAAGFGNWFRDQCNAAGLPHCSAHGLRKAAAARLAELGATEHEIMAVTGHQTLKEVTRYTRAARRKMLAGSAMAKYAAGQIGNESDPLLPAVVGSGLKKRRK